MNADGKGIHRILNMPGQSFPDDPDWGSDPGSALSSSFRLPSGGPLSTANDEPTDLAHLLARLFRHS